jgi:hypothetical protein
MKLRNALMDARERCLARGRCTITEMVEEAKSLYPEVFAQEQARLIDREARRQAKALMREALDADIDEPVQQEFPFSVLPGFRPPAAIAVRDDDGNYRYVRFACATWEELVAGLQEREHNVTRAELRQQDFALKLDRLRPYMSGSPHITVAEACELMAKEASAPEKQ